MANELTRRLEHIEQRLDRLEDKIGAITDIRAALRLFEHDLAALGRLHSPTHHTEGTVDAVTAALLSRFAPLLEGLRRDVKETLRVTNNVFRKETRLATNYERLQSDVDAIGAAVGTIKPQVAELVDAIRSGASQEQLGALADKLEKSNNALGEIEGNLSSINPSQPGGAVDSTEGGSGSADAGGDGTGSDPGGADAGDGGQ